MPHTIVVLLVCKCVCFCCCCCCSFGCLYIQPVFAWTNAITFILFKSLLSSHLLLQNRNLFYINLRAEQNKKMLKAIWHMRVTEMQNVSSRYKIYNITECKIAMILNLKEKKERKKKYNEERRGNSLPKRSSRMTDASNKSAAITHNNCCRVILTR